MAASLARRVLAVTFVYLYDEDMSYNPNCSFLLFFFLFSFVLGMAASLARRVLAVTLFIYMMRIGHIIPMFLFFFCLLFLLGMAASLE